MTNNRSFLSLHGNLIKFNECNNKYTVYLNNECVFKSDNYNLAYNYYKALIRLSF